MPASKESSGLAIPKTIAMAVLLVLMTLYTWNYSHTPQARHPLPEAATRSSGAYEFHPASILVNARNNDGDSFMVRLPSGKEAEFRLYFVDSPESAFKSYSSGETNHDRIRKQAQDMGGTTPEQAVEIGKKAKKFTLDLLASRPFDLYTCWDSPYQDQRFHAFIRIMQDGKSRWLDELLIEQGLVRIRTKPADLPDGTSAAQHLSLLKELQSHAKKSKAGVWSISP